MKISAIFFYEQPAQTRQEKSDLPLVLYFLTGSPRLAYSLSRRTRQEYMNKFPLVNRKTRPTQISTFAFGTRRDPFSCVTAMNRQIDSRLNVVCFLAQRMEQWTEAARSEKLVVPAIDMQCIRWDAFFSVHGPIQTIKTSGGSQRVVAYQKKVSRRSVLGSRESTQLVDFSMAECRLCRSVGTFGNDNVSWRLGMAE